MRLLLEGYYGYLLAISSLGTNSHAHLLVMNLIVNQWVMSVVMLIFWNIFLSLGDFSRRVWVCGRILQENYTLIESLESLDYYIQEPSAILFIWNMSGHIELQLHNFWLFKLYWINFVSYYGWWKCYALPEQQENKTLK